jgi:membrane dipeptidase
MDRRRFLAAAGSLALLPRTPRAQGHALRYADMHSHIAMWGKDAAKESIRAGMEQGGLLLIARKFVGDGPVIRLMAGGYGVHRAAAPGELAANFDKRLPQMRQRHRAEGLAEVLSAADLERVVQARTPAVALAVEGGDFLEGKLERLEAARKLGVVHLQIVHYRVSEIGDICTERPVHGGLSAFGKSVVAHCNRLGILVDVAHGTASGIDQALEISAKPVISSHGFVASYEPSHTMDGARARGLHLPVAKRIAAKGGVVGFWALGQQFRSLGGMADAVAEAAGKLGPAHVGIGSDIAGMPSTVMPSYAAFAELAELLEKRGLKGEDLDNVLGMNYVRVLRQALAA